MTKNSEARNRLIELGYEWNPLRKEWRAPKPMSSSSMDVELERRAAVYAFAEDVIAAFGLGDTYYAEPVSSFNRAYATYFTTATKCFDHYVRAGAKAARAIRAQDENAATLAEFRKDLRDATKEARK